MGLAAMWGVFGATWLLFVTDDLHLDPAVIGVVAALGGFGSLFGALLAERVVARFGLGRVVVASLLFAALGNLLIPLAPPALPLVAIACLIGQQLIGDTAVTVFDVTEVSVRQARVGDRQLGRVNATVRVAMVMAQLGGTLVGGVLAEVIGLRGAAFLAPGVRAARRVGCCSRRPCAGSGPSRPRVSRPPRFRRRTRFTARHSGTHRALRRPNHACHAWNRRQTARKTRSRGVVAPVSVPLNLVRISRPWARSALGCLRRLRAVDRRDDVGTDRPDVVDSLARPAPTRR